ncbi:MAG: hypothetical protein JW828_14880 [Sedimentisphaerales bacterium]|nr:hypothetical protein [Sedimentisphaerales bacterium]
MDQFCLRYSDCPNRAHRNAIHAPFTGILINIHSLTSSISGTQSFTIIILDETHALYHNKSAGPAFDVYGSLRLFNPEITHHPCAVSAFDFAGNLCTDGNFLLFMDDFNKRDLNIAA